MSHIEKEIKILNVNAKETMKKMEQLGVEPKGKYIQDVYTFDFPTVNESFESKLKIAEDTKDNVQLIDFIRDIRPCFTKKDLNTFKSLLGTEDIIEYVTNGGELKKLQCDEINDIIKSVNDNYSKWIRLRQTGKQTTITIKKIVNSSGEYELDAVRELEFEVPSINEGKEFLEALGYYPSLHQKKMRIAYDYNNTELVIDKWPKIPAYIEVEGENKEDICSVVKNLGYRAQDMRVMNTDNVYEENGLDIYSFKNLDFSEDELKEVESILNYDAKEEKEKKNHMRE